MGASPGAQLARTEVQKNRRPKSTNCTTLHYDDDDDDDQKVVAVMVEDARGFYGLHATSFIHYKGLNFSK